MRAVGRSSGQCLLCTSAINFRMDRTSSALSDEEENTTPEKHGIFFFKSDASKGGTFSQQKFTCGFYPCGTVKADTFFTRQISIIYTRRIYDRWHSPTPPPSTDTDKQWTRNRYHQIFVSVGTGAVALKCLSSHHHMVVSALFANFTHVSESKEPFNRHN